MVVRCQGMVYLPIASRHLLGRQVAITSNIGLFYVKSWNVVSWIQCLVLITSNIVVARDTDVRIRQVYQIVYQVIK